MGRPPSCICGSCSKCRARVAARERYQSMTLEERRALIARRDPERVRAADRARYERDKPKRRAAMDQYARENSDIVAAAKRRWAERNPEKRAAHVAVGNAVRDGRLAKLPCEVCGSGRVHAHHDDYSKPLDVRWFCARHHTDLHLEMRDAA